MNFNYSQFCFYKNPKSRKIYESQRWEAKCRVFLSVKCFLFRFFAHPLCLMYVSPSYISPILHFPDITFPRISFPRVAFLQISFSRVTFTRISFPRVMFPQISFPLRIILHRHWNYTGIWGGIFFCRVSERENLDRFKFKFWNKYNNFSFFAPWIPVWIPYEAIHDNRRKSIDQIDQIYQIRSV
jgi:hypothetical protein